MITKQQPPRLKMHKLKRWLADKDDLSYSDNVISVEIDNHYIPSYIDRNKAIDMDYKVLRGALSIEYNENEVTEHEYLYHISPDIPREYLHHYIRDAKFKLVRFALEWFEKIENESPTASLYYAELMDALYKRPFFMEKLIERNSHSNN